MKIAILQTRYGNIEIELFEDEAPYTVEHFCRLAERGFYNGLTFHKYIHDILVQGGCPKGDGTGGTGYFIKCEANTGRHHDQGTVSMAHCGKDTGSSQFFICLSRRNASQFDGVHTCFGKVSNKGFQFIDNLREGDIIESIRVVHRTAD